MRLDKISNNVWVGKTVNSHFGGQDYFLCPPLHPFFTRKRKEKKTHLKKPWRRRL